ncbi:unnamed protein product [Lampetra planeri]
MYAFTLNFFSVMHVVNCANWRRDREKKKNMAEAFCSAVEKSTGRQQNHRARALGTLLAERTLHEQNKPGLTTHYGHMAYTQWGRRHFTPGVGDPVAKSLTSPATPLCSHNKEEGYETMKTMVMVMVMVMMRWRRHGRLLPKAQGVVDSAAIMNVDQFL